MCECKRQSLKVAKGDCKETDRNALKLIHVLVVLSKFAESIRGCEAKLSDSETVVVLRNSEPLAAAIQFWYIV